MTRTKRIESHEEAAERLGLSERATRDDLLKAIAQHAETARQLDDPKMLDLLIGNVEARLREKHGEDFALLREDAVALAKQRAVDDWRRKGRDAQQAADAALAFVRRDLDRTIAARKQLGGEAAQPAANRTERLLAQLLDTHAEAAAEAAIDRLTPEQALARYAAAEDAGTDRAYARTFERLHAAKVLDMSASTDPVKVAKAIREAIEARQAARVPADDTAAVTTCEKLAADLARSSGDPGRVVNAAGREGMFTPLLRERARTPDPATVQ